MYLLTGAVNPAPRRKQPCAAAVATMASPSTRSPPTGSPKTRCRWPRPRVAGRDAPRDALVVLGGAGGALVSSAAQPAAGALGADRAVREARLPLQVPRRRLQHHRRPRACLPAPFSAHHQDLAATPRDNFTAPARARALTPPRPRPPPRAPSYPTPSRLRARPHTLLVRHAVMERVPARRRAEPHVALYAVEDLLRLGMFCGPRLAALAGGDPVVVAPLAGAVAAGGEGSTIVCAFEAWSARQRVT